MSRLPTEKRTEPDAPRQSRGALFVRAAGLIARRVSLSWADACRVPGLPDVLETVCPGDGLMCAVYPGCRSHCVPRAARTITVLDTACPGGGLMCAACPGCQSHSCRVLSRIRRTHCVPHIRPHYLLRVLRVHPVLPVSWNAVRPPDTARYLIGSRARHICPMQVPAGFSERAFLGGLSR